jgi:lysozyme
MSKLIEMLKRHEGVETHAYTDTVGKITLGVGRNIDPNGGIGLSEGEIDFLLYNDIDRVEEELYDNFKWFRTLGDVRSEAMIDICFNLGLPRLKKFKKALAAMEAEDYKLASLEWLDSVWADQVGQRAIELSLMIETGEYQYELDI